MVHVYAVPAKDMPAVRHLRSRELLLQADGAAELFAGVVCDMLHLLPLLLADAVEGGQRVDIVVGERVGVEGEGEPPHEALPAVLRAVPTSHGSYLAALYFTLRRVYSVSIPE